MLGASCENRHSLCSLECDAHKQTKTSTQHDPDCARERRGAARTHRQALCPILGAGAFLEEVTAKLSGTDGACPRRHPQGLMQGQAHSRHSTVLFTNAIWVIQKKAGEGCRADAPAYAKTSRKDGHHGTFASILKEQLAAARVGGWGSGSPGGCLHPSWALGLTSPATPGSVLGGQTSRAPGGGAASVGGG